MVILIRFNFVCVVSQICDKLCFYWFFSDGHFWINFEGISFSQPKPQSKHCSSNLIDFFHQTSHFEFITFTFLRVDLLCVCVWSGLSVICVTFFLSSAFIRRMSGNDFAGFQFNWSAFLRQKSRETLPAATCCLAANLSALSFLLPSSKRNHLIPEGLVRFFAGCVYFFSL